MIAPKKYHHLRKKQQEKHAKSLKQQQLANQQSNSPLFQICDVLHRAQTFLADPYSKPAALLRDVD